MDNTSCLLCGDIQESVLIVLRDCPFAKEVWLKFLSFESAKVLFEVELDEWLLLNFIRTV